MANNDQNMGGLVADGDPGDVNAVVQQARQRPRQKIGWRREGRLASTEAGMRWKRGGRLIRRE